MLTIRHAAAAAAVAAALVAGTASAGVQDDVFSVNNLVSDTADASLVNGWGLSAGPTTPWWVSNNGTNTSTLYNGSGAKQALTVSVPGGPTGTVFNGVATDFVVSQSGKSGAARFLFATEAGQILGWSPTVNGTLAIPGADSSSKGAVYKGLTVAADRLYATDFHNGRVDVFDKSFAPVSLPFTDPKLPKGYAPFGIQAIGTSIFVTYAKQDDAKKDDAAGGGFGYVDQFTTEGQLVARVASGGRKNAPPNAPWGLAMAPASFGVFSRRPAHRQLRERAHQRLPGSRRRQVGLQGPAAPRRPDARHDRRPLGDRVRQRHGRWADDLALLRGRPRRRGARPLRLDHRRLKADDGARLRASGPGTAYVTRVMSASKCRTSRSRSTR